MKRQMFLLILIFLCSCASAGIENAQKATAHYKMGISHLNENNIQPAFVEFQKAYELNPEDKEVLSAIGIIYLLKFDDYKKAIDFFQRAVNIDPNYSDAYNNLGSAYARVKRYDDAINSYRKALANFLYRTPEFAYDNLGMVYYRQGKYDEAIDAFKEGIMRKPDFYKSYYGLALCYNAKGKYGDAATAITKATEIDPSYRGDKNKAIKDLSKRKLDVKGEDEKDINDWLDILKY